MLVWENYAMHTSFHSHHQLFQCTSSVCKMLCKCMCKYLCLLSCEIHLAFSSFWMEYKNPIIFILKKSYIFASSSIHVSLHMHIRNVFLRMKVETKRIQKHNYCIPVNSVCHQMQTKVANNYKMSLRADWNTQNCIQFLKDS